MSRRMLQLLVALGSALLFSGLYLTPILQKAEWAVYDLFLGLSPDRTRREHILFMDVDDSAVAQIGVWPWPRAVLGAPFAIHYVNLVVFDELEKIGIPVITLNNNNYQDRYCSVLTDDVQGAYEGTRHLLSLGHQHFAYAEYERSLFGSVVRDRFFGFKFALDEAGIDFRSDQRITVELRDQSGLERRVAQIFGKPDRPTALFVHDDYFSAILHKVLTQRGLRIPADLSMICPGDVLDYSEPFLDRKSTRLNSSH